MNRTVLRAFIFVMLLAVISSCAKREESEPTPQVRKIMFKALSEESFRDSSKIGFFLKKPSYENVLLTVAGGRVASSEELQWNPDQTEKSSALAYYPYKEGVSSSSDQFFSVQRDQSSEKLLKASDFLVSRFDADPAQDSILLTFNHEMTKACIYFDNRTGMDIRKVEFGGICLSQLYSIWSGPGRVYDSGTVKAFAAEDHYEAYFPGQTSSMSITVTMVGGTVFDYELENCVFTAGEVFSNSDQPIEIVKPAPKIPFDEITEPGFYTGTDTYPQSTLLVKDQELYSFGTTSLGRVLVVADFESGMYKVLNIDATVLTVGENYSAVLDENGSRTAYEELTCVKLTDSLVWLYDKSGNVGFIIPVD